MPTRGIGTEQSPWVLRMQWLDLCFMHWPVPAARVQATLPPGLTVDTWEGQGWLGVVPFRMRDVAPRGTPALPRLSAFPELNLRTYVTVQGRPGVWFYSLDIPERLPVAVARSTFHLPYHLARMWVDHHGGVTRYASQRTQPDAPPGAFAGAYRPSGPVFEAAPGSLEAWLTDRLLLYSADRQGRLYRGAVRHVPWPLQRAEAHIELNTLADPLGVRLEGPPHLLYAAHLDVQAEWIRRV